ncbi:hypothetical protein RCS94_09190 [Orbaceae bacterium ac157xtp]
MRKLRLALLILIAIIWFIVILPYLLIQTTIGANLVSKLVTNNNQTYAISIGHISHSLFNPYELTLEDVVIQNHTQTKTHLKVDKLIVGLNQDDPFQTDSFNYLIIEKGEIQLNALGQNIQADLLQLKEINIEYQNDETQIQLNNVYGGIKPWSNSLLTERSDSQFNFTVQKASINQLNVEAIYANGFQKNQILTVTQFGGNINQGFITAKFNIQPDNSWDIEQLKVNNLNFKSDSAFFNEKLSEELLSDLPKINIRQLSVIDSSLVLPNFILEKGNLEAKNLIYQNRLQLQKSDLTFNAQSLVINEELLEEPLIFWNTNQGDSITYQLTTKWYQGLFKINGVWQPNNLMIDNFIITGIRYQLPQNWYQTLTNLPLDRLPNTQIKQFMLMPSLIIDTNSAFPFQFSALQVLGNDITLTNRELKGNLLLSAESGTLNTIELAKPDLSVDLTPTTNALNFISLIDDGMIEGKITFAKNPIFDVLFLKSYNVKSDILSSWDLVKNPPLLNQFELTLNKQNCQTNNNQTSCLNGLLQSTEQRYAINNRIVIDR